MDTSKNSQNKILKKHNVDTRSYASLSNKLFKLNINNKYGPEIYIASITTKLLDDLSTITSYVKIIPTVLKHKSKYQTILHFDNIHFDKYRIAENELQLKYKNLKICCDLYGTRYSKKHFISLITKTISEIFTNCTFNDLIISSKKCFYSFEKKKVIPKKQCIKHYVAVIKQCNIKTIRIDSNLLELFDLSKQKSKEIKIVYNNKDDEDYINKFDTIKMIFNKSSQNTPLNIKAEVEELEIYHPPVPIISHIINGIKNKITKITLHIDVSNDISHDISHDDTNNITILDNIIESYDALFEFVITEDDNDILKLFVTHLEKYCGKKKLSIISQTVDKKKEESSSDDSSSDDSSSDESSSDDSSLDF